MNRAAIIQTAMQAATDSEWGYESDDALACLQSIDPAGNWSADLLQAELEAGHRQMGPAKPPRPLTPLEEMICRESLRIFSSTGTVIREVNRELPVGSTIHVRVPARFGG